MTERMRSAAACESEPSVTVPRPSLRAGAVTPAMRVRDPLDPAENAPRPRSTLLNVTIGLERASAHSRMLGRRSLWSGPLDTETTAGARSDAVLTSPP